MAIQERLATIIKRANNANFNHDLLKILTPDLQDKIMPDLSTKEGQNVISEYLDDIEFAILDNLSTLRRTGRVNQEEAENIAFREVFESINKKINNITL